MKRASIACLLLILFVKTATAQSARVNVVIVNAKAFSGNIYLFDPNAPFNPVKRGAASISLNKGTTGSGTIGIKQPGPVNLDLIYSIEGKAAKDNITYTLFLTPGDDLTLRVDLGKKTNNITVTGKGSNNNQPDILALTNIFSGNEFADDKTPARAIAVIDKQQKLNKDLLNNYIAKYKPSDDFIKFSQMNAVFYAPVKYFFIKAKNLDPSRNYGPWQKAQDSLFTNIKNNAVGLTPKFKDEVVAAILTTNTPQIKLRGPANLNNDAALVAYNYTYLVSFFTERENERLWMEESANPAAFYKELYHTSVTNGKKLYTDEQRSLLREHIINRYFSGKTAEYLYYEWLKENLYRSNYKNITLIFDRFKQRYPTSKYIAEFTGPINEIVKKQTQALNDKMVFVANNGTKLNTLKDVLALTKGKTVFVDMWGTWCSPCREEIEKDSGPLRAYFKGKGVDFLYIANHDVAHEKEWKKLIAYYHMEGLHILANDKLDRDIMTKVKSSGYPTYFIIKKDGTFQKSKAQYPIDLQALTKELELASR